MKKTIAIILGAIVAIIAFCGIFYISAHNSIINLEQEIDRYSADIDVQLERRADLIPNLVNAVKGYMGHEEKIINDITTARENLTKANSIEEKSAANQELQNAINSLYVIVENYPDLKANTNFINLQDELAGTENRIATARKDYNDAVKKYNTKIKTLPTSIVAGMMNAEEKAYFEADESKKAVPEVKF